ncbi:uncharacterized protein LOC128202415 [Galleria mellonella]|uniref:Uncharacterized protein LOC128202415 n=1 Tax=Galleria mellonella TaxID=7137 RepID=A0ABM3N4W5_GALME|nr:uncharacterized protein LOC128202415 [Galleria mellonella]
MDSGVRSQDECIRKIEDIIDIQKARGNYNVRQVAFNLPSETGSAVFTNLARSLESGLSEPKQEYACKKSIKFRTRRHKSPVPDVTSWPSDSDITVLRMKLCLKNNDLKENVATAIPGDGLHQSDSSSMVNLATLVLQSQHPSKHSVNIEEYLLPLTSWEQTQDQEIKVKDLQEEQASDYLRQLNGEVKLYEAMCSYKNNDDLNLPDREIFRRNKKSRVARFLRLYFCPCCTCLYKIERRRDESSACFTKRKECK